MRQAPVFRSMPIVAALLAVSCQSNGPGSGTRDYSAFSSPQDPGTTAVRIAENVRACWFGGERPAFANYSYAPELNSYSGRPRVLIVPKSNPSGLPHLVVEASKGDRGTVVKLFGPLMASSEGAALTRDVRRWAEGSTGC